MPTERWKPIPGYSGFEVSNLGRIRSLTRQVSVKPNKQCPNGQRTIAGRLYTPQANSVSGYLCVRIKDDAGVTQTAYVHRLVVLAFRGPDDRYVLHRDDNRKNNALSNLRYGTAAENTNDSRRNGTLAVGSRLPQSVLNEQSVRRMKRILFPRGLTDREIGEMYGVHYSAIYKIRKGQRWTHVE